MKRVLTTLISCLVLLSTTLSAPALAEVKDEVAQSDASVVQDALTVAACGVQSVLNGAKTQITELFSTSEQVALDENESAPAPVRASSQDTVSVGVVSSNLDGVEWSQDYTTCTLQSDHSVDGLALRWEIMPHIGDLTTFKAEDKTGLTGSASELFSGCTSLTMVDLASSFDTSAVTDMRSMFAYCSNLTSLALPKDFNTSKVTNMSNMFKNCSGLTSVTFLDAFTPGVVTDMSSMFSGCSGLTSLTLPKDFNTSKVTNMSNMFKDCSGLTSLTLPNAFNTSEVQLMNNMFTNCSSLTSLKLSDTFNTGAVTNMLSMFEGCSRLNSLALPDAFNTGAVTNMSYMFQNCSGLTSLTLPDAFDLKAAEEMVGMFQNCSSLTSLTLPYAFDPKAAQNLSCMFMDCTHLEKIHLPMSSSENLTGCVAMFANCNSLKELNLGNFVPPAGWESSAMFAACDIDSETGEGDIFGSIPNIEKITMSGACILAPGEGTTLDTASGTFFDYKEPLSWNAYYLGNAAEGQPSDSSTQGNLSAEPTAVLTGFDEFKAYQETHPGLTTYIFDEQPTPPGPTPDPTPEPTPDPTPDVMPASDTDALPLTGDMSVAPRNSLFVVLLGVFALFVAGSSLSRKRSL